MPPSNNNETLTVSPSPANVGDTVTVSGSGYDPKATLLRVVAPDTLVQSYGVGVHGDGSLNPTPIVVTQAGEYLIETWQPLDYGSPDGIGKKTKLQASVTVQVS